MHRHTDGRSPPLGVDHDSSGPADLSIRGWNALRPGASQHPHGLAPALPGEGVDVELAAQVVGIVLQATGQLTSALDRHGAPIEIDAPQPEQPGGIHRAQ
jgi:hypothetical protein